jgi:hypothetical protein
MKTQTLLISTNCYLVLLSLWAIIVGKFFLVHGFLLDANSHTYYSHRQKATKTATSPSLALHKTSTKIFATVSTEESSSAKTSDEPETLTLFSPCKINLFLRIIRKREDGYHDLASLFQAIGFGDTLELTPLIQDRDDGSGDDDTVQSDEFTCNMPGVPVDSTNLVLRALELMRTKTGINQYFKANLIKQVPAQAGLGGGSANAATTMWAANTLMGNPASLDQVSDIVAQICPSMRAYETCFL